MTPIYKPKGKASEYSPQALNVYNGCNHNCDYCYLPRLHMSKTEPKFRENLLYQLDRQLDNGVPKEQVLLSFACDPFCKLEIQYNQTVACLCSLRDAKIPVAILTKGDCILKRYFEAKPCPLYPDMIGLYKEFGQNIKIGTTLTTISGANEPHALPVLQRLEMLQTLKEAGIRTFISFEPVFSWHEFKELFKVGRYLADEIMIGLDSRPNGYKLSKEELQYFVDFGIAWSKETIKILYKQSLRDALTKAFPGYVYQGSKPDDLFLKGWKE